MAKCSECLFITGGSLICLMTLTPLPPFHMKFELLWINLNCTFWHSSPFSQSMLGLYTVPRENKLHKGKIYNTFLILL